MINVLALILLTTTPSVSVETAITIPINGYNLLYGSSLSVSTFLPLRVPIEPLLSVDLSSIKGDHDYFVRFFTIGLGVQSRIAKVKFGFRGILSKVERKFGEGGDSGTAFGARGLLNFYIIKIGYFAGFLRLKVTTFLGKTRNLTVVSGGIGLEHNGF